MKSRLPLSGLLLPALLALAATSGCRDEKAAVPAAKPPVVQVTALVETDKAVPIRAVGILARKQETPLSFKIGGIIESVSVRAGDRVAAGQELARLRLDEIDAQVSQAKSAAGKANRDRARIENLQAGHVATLENLQDARTAVEIAEAQLRTAEFNRQYAIITAPQAGSILRRSAEPGELTAPGRPVIDFAGDGQGWILRTSLSDTDTDRVRLGDAAVLDSHGTGRITQIAGGSDPLTRTVPVEITPDSIPEGQRSGQVVPATLQPSVGHPHLLIPASALIEGAGKKASIFYLDTNASLVHRASVELETLEDGIAHIRTDLPAGTRVVTAGGEYLRDGATVEVKP